MSAPAPVAGLLDGVPDLALDWLDDGWLRAAPPSQLVPPPRKSLRDLLDDVDAIRDTLDSLDDDTLDDAARDDLSRMLVAAIAGTREKVDRTAGVLAQLEADAAAAAAECARLADRRKRFERHAARLADYVLAALSASNLNELRGNTATLTRRANPVSVVVDDPTAVPAEFLRVPDPPPPSPDKAAIKAALKAGGDVSGCRLIQAQRLVRS